jgi:trehalose 6-phosphate phosphatase
MAVLGGNAASATSSGTMMTPPPTPNRPEKKPAARPTPTRIGTRPDTAGIVAAVDARLVRLVAPLVADPKRSAVVCDIDGTLAPIVPTPADARVPDATLEILDRVAARYGLVACVTGRPAAEARRLVPVETVAISGNHGLEVWRDGAVHLAPQAAKHSDSVRRALVMVQNDGLLPQLGCQVEDKGITFTVHFRTSPRADHARRYLEAQIVPKLEREGLAASFGRKVLEVRPPVPLDKGSAVRRLRGRRKIAELLFCGDDRSDIDAFHEATRRVAVHSPEAPAELLELADAVVDGPPQVAELLDHLARG